MTELVPTSGALPDSPAERRRLVAIAVAERDDETLKRWRNIADAAERLAVRENLMEIALDAADMRLRVERGLAILDVEAAPHGSDRRSSSVPTELDPGPLGTVEKNARAAIRSLALLDEDELEHVLTELRAVESLSTGAAARLARELHPKTRQHPADRLRGEAGEIDRRLKAIDRDSAWIDRHRQGSQFGWEHENRMLDRIRKIRERLDHLDEHLRRKP